PARADDVASRRRSRHEKGAQLYGRRSRCCGNLRMVNQDEVRRSAPTRPGRAALRQSLLRITTFRARVCAHLVAAVRGHATRQRDFATRQRYQCALTLLVGSGPALLLIPPPSTPLKQMVP